MKIPLAWLQLTREKMRLLVAIAGISFADILMFLQLGFRDGLLESSVNFHAKLQGDIFLVSPQSTALIAMKSFPQRRLYQTLGMEGVKSIIPIYLGFAIWKNPENRRPRQLMIIGFNPADNVLNLPEYQEKQEKIKQADIVLFDDASRPEFGPISTMFKNQKSVETEVGGRRIKVGGLFTLGASFGADGNLITSDVNFLRLFPKRDKGLIDIGVIQLNEKDPEKINNIIKTIKESLPNDVKILSKEEFVEFERKYWEEGTSIGFIFGLGVGMGFIVGIVIVYQILYTDVSDHLAEYATLKAMGYTDNYLLIVVFQEALILAVFGYMPSFFICIGLYDMIAKATMLPVAMTMYRAVLVIVLTIIMCGISGFIAVRKLRSADPADIF